MDVEITNAPDRSRYELRIDGRVVGVADYRAEGGTLVFPHTEIDPAMRGRGLGARLVGAALDDVRARGGTVVPRCWFVARFIDDHPEYRSLVDSG